MSIFSNKFVVAIIAIVVGILVLIGLPVILKWIIGIVLIVWGILALLGKK